MTIQTYDLAVTGAGIVGLAHALAGLRQGLRVAVIDREARAAGASVRNFGFVTVTGQQEGLVWRRAMRSRMVWGQIAPVAGIAVHQRGLLMVARRPAAMDVLEDFAAGPMGAECRLLGQTALREAAPMLDPAGCEPKLWDQAAAFDDASGWLRLAGADGLSASAAQ